MDADKYKIVKTIIPTYIREIFDLDKDQFATLVYANSINTNIEVQNTRCNSFLEESSIKIEKEEDLSGNPLEVDLGGDGDLCELSVIIKQPNSWTKHEEEHLPLDISAARKLMNTLCMNHSNSVIKLPSWIYCICDGKQNKTVIIGCCPKKWSRTLVRIKGCYAANDPEIQLANILKLHQNNCCNLSGTAITITVTSVYSLEGWNLRNDRSPQASLQSSAILKATWHEVSYTPVSIISNDSEGAELTLQVIAGHKDSKLYMFWDKLCFLQTKINLLRTSEDLDSECIANNYMEVFNIISTINEMKLEHQNLKKGSKIGEKKKKKLDFENLRDEDFWDKLFNILNNCEDVESLKACFTLMFEEFSQNILKIKNISNKNTTYVAKIINGLCEGTLAVPTISSAQAVIFLIELGIEKLKNDYFYLLEYFFDEISLQNILNDWDMLVQVAQKNVETNRFTSVGLSAATRFTRKTMKGESIDDPSLGKKINFLSKLHIILEFLFVVKSCDYLDKITGINISILDILIKKYFKTSNIHPFIDLQQDPLCELVVDLFSLGSEYYESLTNQSRNIKMTSTCEGSLVTTIVHQSLAPIFPTTMFNDYDLSVIENREEGSEESLVYYVNEAIVLGN